MRARREVRILRSVLETIGRDGTPAGTGGGDGRSQPAAHVPQPPRCVCGDLRFDDHVCARWTIFVCPECGDHPLVFDPTGMDRAEGMTPRATCCNGHLVLSGYARRVEVEAVR